MRYMPFRASLSRASQRLPLIASLGLIFGLAFAGATSAHAATFTVTTLADEDDGTPNPGFGTGSSLREVINAANTVAGDDTIVFAPWVTGTLNLTRALPAIFTNITLQGPGANKLTVTIDDSVDITYDGFSLFVVANQTPVSISGLTLYGGVAFGTGGGGVHNGGDLNLTDCTVNDCLTSGIFNASGGHLTVLRCAIYNNYLGQGGGVSNHGALTLSNCTLSNNFASAGNGGGLFNGGSASVTHCTFSGNRASTPTNPADHDIWNVITNRCCQYHHWERQRPQCPTASG